MSLQTVSKTYSLTLYDERDPDTPWIGGWVVPRAVLDTVVKNCQHPPGIETYVPDHPARSLDAITTEL